MNFNLNREALSLNTLPLGKTQNIKIKLGRSTYMCDIEKTAIVSVISFYPGPALKQKAYLVTVKSNAILDRTFFVDIPHIAYAQQICSLYKGILT